MQYWGIMITVNLVPRAHVPFGQHQDTELWNNQFPETKILGLPASHRMRGLVYMAPRDRVDVDTFHKGIQYALKRLGKSKFGLEPACWLFQSPVSWCWPKGTWALLLYMSRAASMCRDDFLPGITWGDPARLMADTMNHGRPERAWFWCDEGLMSRAVSRDPGTVMQGSRLTGLARLSCNREVDFYGV